MAKALREFAKLTERREVATLPMLLWGHSAGGQYAYGVAGYAPQRVIAFVAIKGGYYHSRPKPTIVKVPGLFIRGANDLPRRKKNITSAYNFGRRRRAAWCLAEEPRAGHEVGMSNRLIVPFFKSVLAGRVRTAEEARTIPSSACGMTITSGSRWRTISEGAVAKEICG